MSILTLMLQREPGFRSLMLNNYWEKITMLLILCALQSKRNKWKTELSLN